MTKVSYRMMSVVALAAFLSGCGGPVPDAYQAKWNCGQRELWGFDLIVTVSSGSVSWPATSHANAWTAKVTGVQTPGDGGVILQLAENSGPFGTMRLRPVGDGMAIEGRRCRKS